MPFGDSISELVPLAPARILREATTDGTYTAPYQLIDFNANFINLVQPYDLVVNVTDSTSTLVVKVIDDHHLRLREDIMGANKQYRIVRGRGIVLRPGYLTEWTIQNIFSPGKQLYDVKVFATDGVRMEPLFEAGETGLTKTGLVLKATYNKGIAIFNYDTVSRNVIIEGLDKTLRTEQ